MKEDQDAAAGLPKIINFNAAQFIMNFIAIVQLTSHQVESHYGSEMFRFWKLKISFSGTTKERRINILEFQSRQFGKLLIAGSQVGG